MRNVKVDHVIKRVHTRVDKDNTDLLYYASGEQVDEGRLLMDKRGLIEGSTIGPMFYYGFKRGDLLIPSRSISSHKASVATYDGICSEKTFVLDTADESVLLHDYLPFVFQNERFWTYAERTSHGSTNAFLNWKALKDYEFPLPSVEEQREIADVLWAANRVIEDYRAISDQLDELVKSRFVEMFGDAGALMSRWPKMPLAACVNSIDSGKSVNCKSEARTGSAPGVLKLSALSSGKYLPEENKAMFDGESVLPGKEVMTGDILVARKNTPDLVGTCVMVDCDVPNLMFPDLVFRMHPIAGVNGTYLSILLGQSSFSETVRSLAHGSAKSMSNIPKSELGKLEIPFPPFALQREFANFVIDVDKSRVEVQRTLPKLHNLSSAIVRERVNDIHV